jgi:hypothetical protein
MKRLILADDRLIRKAGKTATAATVEKAGTSSPTATTEKMQMQEV